MLPEVKSLIVERDDDVLTVWFNSPETRNALTGDTFEELIAITDALSNMKEIRILVFRGKGGIFCAGGDIKAFKQVFQGNADHQAIAASNALFGHFSQKLNSLPQTVMMLVEGAAMGGGLGFACLGDVTITTADTKYSLSETSLGIPPAQIAPFVVERIGITQARRLMLTGAKFDGDEARALGIAHFSVENTDALIQKAEEIIKQIRRCAPGANAKTKQIMFATQRLHGDEMINFAADAFADCMLSEEGTEGVAAFIEKRKPLWAK
jgi:isohexenylglutaconyl-CoA hydratase